MNFGSCRKYMPIHRCPAFNPTIARRAESCKLVVRLRQRAHLQEHCPMHPNSDTLTRFLRSSAAVLLLALAGNCGIARAQAKTAAVPANPKIRAITAFINVDRARYKEQVADALKMLRRAQTTFESRGYQVQNIRIATQPFPEYTKGLTKERSEEHTSELQSRQYLVCRLLLA